MYYSLWGNNRCELRYFISRKVFDSVIFTLYIGLAGILRLAYSIHCIEVIVCSISYVF